MSSPCLAHYVPQRRVNLSSVSATVVLTKKKATLVSADN